MADSGNAGSWAVNLNEQQLSPFNQILMHQQQMAQQNKLRQDAIDEHNQNREDKQREIRDRYQAGLLQKYGDADYRTPIQKWNDYSGKVVGDVLRKFSTDPSKKNLSDAEFQAQLQQEFTPIIQGHKDIANKIAVEQNAINQLYGQHKNWLDKEGLTNDMLKRIQDNYVVEDDGKGHASFKPINPVDITHSDAADMLANDKTGKYFNEEAIPAYLESIKKGAGVKKIYNASTPNGDFTYTGQFHPGLQEEQAQFDKSGLVKGQPSFAIKSQANRVDKNGNPMTVLPEDAFANHIVSSPFQQQAFNKLLYRNAQGADGKMVYDPEDINNKLRFGHIIASQALQGNQPEQSHWARPAKSTTNINLGAKDVPVIDAFSSINKLMGEHRNTLPLAQAPAELQAYLINKADELNPEEKFSNANTVVVKNNDGTYTLNKAKEYTGADGFKHIGATDQIFTIDPTGTNLAANKGGGQKVHNKVVSQGGSPNPAPSPVGNTKQKVYKGIDKNGNPIFE